MTDTQVYDFKEIKLSKLNLIPLEGSTDDYELIYNSNPGIYVIGGPIILKKYINDDYAGFATFANDSHEFNEFINEFELALCEKIAKEISTNVKMSEIHKRIKPIIEKKLFIRQEFTNDVSDGKLSVVVFQPNAEQAVEDLTIESFEKYFKPGDKFLPIYYFNSIKVGKKIVIDYSIVQMQQISKPVEKKVQSKSRARLKKKIKIQYKEETESSSSDEDSEEDSDESEEDSDESEEDSEVYSDESEDLVDIKPKHKKKNKKVKKHKKVKKK